MSDSITGYRRGHKTSAIVKAELSLPCLLRRTETEALLLVGAALLIINDKLIHRGLLYNIIIDQFILFETVKCSPVFRDIVLLFILRNPAAPFEQNL